MFVWVTTMSKDEGVCSGHLLVGINSFNLLVGINYFSALVGIKG